MNKKIENSKKINADSKLMDQNLWDGNFVDVDTGEVRVSSSPGILRALALGSCVAVAAYDRYKKIGGLAHVMLPGKSPSGEGENREKYTEDAIDVLLDSIKEMGTKTQNLEVNLVGGANILGEGTISEEIMGSVLGYLEKLNIEPKNKRLGGRERRSVSLDIVSGRIFYTEGDSAAKEL